jgi:hypothetical protein
MAEVEKGIETYFSMDNGFGSGGTIYKDGRFVIRKANMLPMGHCGMAAPLQTIYEYNKNILYIKKARGSTIYTKGYEQILEPYHFICTLNNYQINIIFNILTKMFDPDDPNLNLDNVSKIKLLDEYWYSEQQKSKETIEELTSKYELQIKQLQDENELLKTKSGQSSQRRAQSYRRAHSENRAPERRTPSRRAPNRNVSNRRRSSNARRTSKGYSV